MRRRMLDALQSVSGVESAALVDKPPLAMDTVQTTVFTDDATDLKPSNASANPFIYNVSPGYFHAAGTAFIAGKTSPGTTMPKRHVSRSSIASSSGRSSGPLETPSTGTSNAAMARATRWSRSSKMASISTSPKTSGRRCSCQRCSRCRRRRGWSCARIAIRCSSPTSCGPAPRSRFGPARVPRNVG